MWWHALLLCCIIRCRGVKVTFRLYSLTVQPRCCLNVFSSLPSSLVPLLWVLFPPFPLPFSILLLACLWQHQPSLWAMYIPSQINHKGLPTQKLKITRGILYYLTSLFMLFQFCVSIYFSLSPMYPNAYTTWTIDWMLIGRWIENKQISWYRHSIWWFLS